jgi:pyruvate kinase
MGKPTEPSGSPPMTASEVRHLEATLQGLRSRMIDLAKEADAGSFGPNRESARNLLHYVALRRFDLRSIQVQLARLGLSSLGRAESDTLYNLDAVLARLHDLQGGRPRLGPPEEPTPRVEGIRRLERNASELLGPAPPGRRTRIMVTMPTEAATNYPLVRDLLEAGMDCMRINCAHDTEAEWAGMVANLRRAQRALGGRCRIQMDLGGPKLRTGPIQPGPPVLKIRPSRDAFGRVTRPAVVWLTPSDYPDAPPRGVDAVLPVDRSWLKDRRARDRVRFVDARGASRSLRVLRAVDASLVAELHRTAYVTPDTELWAAGANRRKARTRVGPIPSRDGSIHLEVGDLLDVTARPLLGHGPQPRRGGHRATPGVISCTLPEALAAVRPGYRIWFDDGKIGGVVRTTTPSRLRVEITHTAPGGSQLRADKGINIPDIELDLSPLTEEDRRHLRFIVRHAEIVGYSFVHAAADVGLLRAELARLKRPNMGIVLKIETRTAFEKLPAILLAALRARKVGVMIARGDLAVEAGYERLAEVQEEILWLCEAAHLPSVWATDVLQGLAKTGLPTRAEVTDAAMGQRSECVMLNKGPHIVQAVRVLDSILRRMEAHQEKKSARLRHLSVAERFFQETEAKALGLPRGPGPSPSPAA